MLLLPMALLLVAFALTEIVTTGGDWADWAWLCTGVLGIAVAGWGEIASYRLRRRTREQLQRP